MNPGRGAHVLVVFLSPASMRFHPKSRASTDHAPGPSSTNAAPMVPNRTFAHTSPGREMVFHNPRAATSDPEIGVHKPATRSIALTIASTTRMAGSLGGRVRSLVSSGAMIAIPATHRIKRRPTPGQPQANVENRRRKIASCPASPAKRPGVAGAQRMLNESVARAFQQSSNMRIMGSSTPRDTTDLG